MWREVSADTLGEDPTCHIVTSPGETVLGLWTDGAVCWSISGCGSGKVYGVKVCMRVPPALWIRGSSDFSPVSVMMTAVYWLFTTMVCWRKCCRMGSRRCSVAGR